MVTAFILPLTTAPILFNPPSAQYLYPNTANTDPAIHLPMYSKEAVTIVKIYIDD